MLRAPRAREATMEQEAPMPPATAAMLANARAMQEVALQHLHVQEVQREALARAELVALGRESIGALPYFEDLGLSSDDSFLLALGRRATPEALCRLAPALARSRAGIRAADARASRAAWRMRAASRHALRRCFFQSGQRKPRR